MSGPSRVMRRGLFIAQLLGVCAVSVDAAEPAAERARELVRLVRQDCGSCHGMQLSGGLGPPLRPDALAGKPLESLVATILHGRPGTPMPPWRGFLSESEARWIVQRLVSGFPEEAGR